VAAEADGGEQSGDIAAAELSDELGSHGEEGREDDAGGTRVSADDTGEEGNDGGRGIDGGEAGHEGGEEVEAAGALEQGNEEAHTGDEEDNAPGNPGEDLILWGAAEEGEQGDGSKGGEADRELKQEHAEKE